MSSLVLGCNGLLSGSGSVIADLQARLFRAVTANDLAEARRLNDRIYPLMGVFYADPFVDMHNRMKEALVLSAACRAPWCGRHWSRSASRRSRAFAEALVAAGLLDETGEAARSCWTWLTVAGGRDRFDHLLIDDAQAPRQRS